MKKIIIDEDGRKVKITSNMKESKLRSFSDFTEKQQKDILDKYDYMDTDDIKNNLYIDEYTSLSDILCLNSRWTSTSSILEETLYNIVNKNNTFFEVGYIDCSYYREYYAIDAGLDCFIKLNVDFLEG